MNTKIKIKYLEELERKNNLVLKNIERLQKYYPNIKNNALFFADKIEQILFDIEMKDLNF